MREGVFQVGGCGSRFDSHLHFPTHQKSVFQKGLGSSVFNQTTPRSCCPGESPRSQTPPGLISTKGQHRTQSSFLQRPAGKRQLVGRQGRLPSTKGPRAGGTGAPWAAASLVTCGYCYSLASRRREGWDRAEKWLAQTLANVSVRSDTQGVVAPRREAAAEPCA